MQLEIRNISKTYPNGVEALKDVSLTIPKGMFGLLGPNGAGKSTLMRTIATLQEVDSGEIFLGDIDVLRDKQSVREKLGYLPQEFGVYPRISAEVMLDHVAQLKGIGSRSDRKETVEYLLQKMNLYKDRKKALGTFSGGMRQRFGIAQALVGNPLLLIVDEPTAGLDPAERNRFYNLLSELGENTIVILSSHIVEDISTLCSNMAIICQGQVLLVGQPKDCVLQLQDRIFSKTIDRQELEQYKQLYKVVSTKLMAGQLNLRVESEFNPGNEFVAVEPDLEDVYFSHIANHMDIVTL